MENKKDTNPKSASRLACVQAIYSLNIDTIDSFENKNEILSHAIAEIKADGTKVREAFAKKIFEFAISEEDSIKFIVAKYLEKNKKIEDINPLLYAVIRCAMAEMLCEQDTPKKVIITEYTKIAESFFSRTEAGFVNAVLDKYYKSNLAA